MTKAIRAKMNAKLQSWKETLKPYSRPSRRRSIWQLANSIVPYLGLWYLAYRLLDVSYWATVGASVLAAGFLVRIFIIAHDCGHGSFFRSRKANAFWGGITSFMPFLPYHAWRHEHAVHHAHSGNLDRRGMGDIETLTVKEYVSRTRWERFRYRAYRHPVVMLVIGPLYTFLISYRFWPSRATRRVKMSVMRTNAALAIMVVAMTMMIGVKAFVLVQLPILLVSGAAGIWLFYVQHQFEGVYWERNEKWDFVEQSLKGSSYYKLPRVLQWFSGNIGFHHIHHLSAKVPNYYLEKCQKEIAAFHRVKAITLLSSLKSLSFRLWDEEKRKLVGFAVADAMLRSQAEAAR